MSELQINDKTQPLHKTSVSKSDFKLRAFVRNCFIVDVVSIDFNNEFITWDDNQFDRCVPPNKCYEIETFDEIILIKPTGLTDVSGKEIYVGDIVKWGHLKGSEENHIRIAVVKIEPDIKFEIINYKQDFAGQNRTFHYGSFAYKNTNDCLEIIGNIFENPNLLPSVL